jgi:hypothetical protein
MDALNIEGISSKMIDKNLSIEMRVFTNVNCRIEVGKKYDWKNVLIGNGRV